MIITKKKRIIGNNLLITLILLVVISAIFFESIIPILTIAPFIIIFIVKLYKIYMYDLVIILLPVMFYIHIPFTINISMADFIMPFLFYRYFLYKSNDESKKEKKTMNIILKYGLILIWIMGISLINLVRILENALLLQAIASIAKIVICLAYAMITLKYLIRSGSHRFLKVWYYAGMGFCMLMIVGVVAYYNGIDLGLTFEGTFRATGTFEDPNLAASHLFLIFSFITAYCLKNKKYVRLIISILIIVGCILLTSSKGALVSFACGSVALFTILISKGNLKTVFKLAILYTVLFTTIILLYNKYEFVREILEPIFNRLEEFTGNVQEDHSLSHRAFLWNTALELGMKYPILGVGVEQFRPAASILTGTHIWNIVHNTYLTFWAETGILGLLAFLWLYINIFFRAIIKLKENKCIPLYLFSMCTIAVSMYSVSLQNFRVLWVFLAYLVYELYYLSDKEQC